MPKPKSKEELLRLSEKNYQYLVDYVQGLSEDQREIEFIPGTMNRNIRDVLYHLHQWHVMFLGWYKVGMAGEKPEMPAKGYKWNMLPELNRMIWQNCQNTSLVKCLELLKQSHDEVAKIISVHSDKELFEKKRYAWTGSTSLGAYLISTTSSHYDWAIKLLHRIHREMQITPSG